MNKKLNELAEQYEESLPESYTWSECCDDDEGIHGVCSVCEIEKRLRQVIERQRRNNYD